MKPKVYIDNQNLDDKFTDTLVVEFPYWQIQHTVIYKSLHDFLQIKFSQNDTKRNSPDIH